MIIGINGKLQSGKSSSCKYITAEIMKKKGLISEFEVNIDGNITVPAYKNGEYIYGVFDLESRNQSFKDWASNFLWPHVKIFNLADPLKESICKYYDIDEKLAWGNKKDKDTKTSVLWKDVKDIYPLAEQEGLEKRLTIRDIMIVYGYCVRAIDPNAFIKACLHNIKNSTSKISLIGDIRYSNEIYTFKNAGAKLIRLKKIVEVKNTPSETEMDVVPDSEFDLVVEADVSMYDKNVLIKEKLYEWGVL